MTSGVAVPLEAVTGWDLGGAHLKAAALDGDGCVQRVLVRPCPLWRGLHHLETATGEALALLGNGARRHAVTMTGELADVFPDRREGVRALVASMAARLRGSDLLVYAGPAGFLPGARATSRPEQVASANWFASATLVAERIGSGLFLDVGSTTTDIVPIAGGRVRNRGYTDHERLRYDELVYTGVVRTPVAALATRVPFAGDWLSLMSEQFATAADVHRLTGALPERADLLSAADGGAKTVEASTRRLARTIGLDLDGAPPSAWQRLAGYLSERQRQRIRDACERVLSRDLLDASTPVIGAGVGRFLAEELAGRLGRPYVDFGSLVEAAAERERVHAADCAPAVAVAELARTWAA